MSSHNRTKELNKAWPNVKDRPAYNDLIPLHSAMSQNACAHHILLNVVAKLCEHQSRKDTQWLTDRHSHHRHRRSWKDTMVWCPCCRATIKDDPHTSCQFCRTAWKVTRVSQQVRDIANTICSSHARWYREWSEEERPERSYI